MPDLSGLAAGASAPQPGPDPSAQFMQLAKQLEDMAMAIAGQYPPFATAAEAIKKAIQQGASETVPKMKQANSAGPSAGMSYLG